MTKKDLMIIGSLLLPAIGLLNSGWNQLTTSLNQQVSNHGLRPALTARHPYQAKVPIAVAAELPKETATTIKHISPYRSILTPEKLAAYSQESSAYNTGSFIRNPNESPLTSDQIHSILKHYNSPAADLGIEQDLADLYEATNLRGRVLLAMDVFEGDIGAKGTAGENANPGNVQPPTAELLQKAKDSYGVEIADFGVKSGFADFSHLPPREAWLNGFKLQAAVVRITYADNGRKQLLDMMMDYAPWGDGDNNPPKYAHDALSIADTEFPEIIKNVEDDAMTRQLRLTKGPGQANMFDQALPITTIFGHYDSGYPHYGLDVGLKEGSIYTPEDGTVIEIEKNCPHKTMDPCSKGKGNHEVIQLDKGGILQFFHNDPTVEDGQKVKAGQKVGEIHNGETSGMSTGPHVHIQYSDNSIENEEATNPAWRFPYERYDNEPLEGNLFGADHP